MPVLRERCIDDADGESPPVGDEDRLSISECYLHGPVTDGASKLPQRPIRHELRTRRPDTEHITHREAIRIGGNESQPSIVLFEEDAGERRPRLVARGTDPDLAQCLDESLTDDVDRVCRECVVDRWEVGDA